MGNFSEKIDMFLKKIQTFLCIISLLFTPEMILAKSDLGFSLEIDTLLLKHQEIKTGSLSLDLMRKHGNQLMDQTARLLNRLSKNDLKNPKVQELINHQNRLQNFTAIDQHFRKCVKNNNGSRQLDQRILAQALKSTMTHPQNLENDCKNYENSIKNFQTFNQDIVKVMKATILPDAIKDFSLKALENSARSLLSLKFKFHPKYSDQSRVNDHDLNNLIKELTVRNQSSALSKIENDELFNKLKLYAQSQLTEEKKFNFEQAAMNINKKITQLNSSLSKISLQNEKGFIFDSAKMNDPESFKKFEQYLNTYSEVVSSDAGVLMLTNTLKEKAGEIKRYDSEETIKDKKRDIFVFSPHKNIGKLDVEKAYNEAEKKILAGARELNLIKNRVKTSPKDMQEDIEELVKINPLSIGQMLALKPEYAGVVCDAINKIQSSDEAKEERDKYFMIGGAVLGGALLLTGVGTFLGAYMITGSVTAGVAAGTIGGSIMTGTIVAGAALETCSLIHFGHRAIQYQNEANKFEASILSGNGDAKSIQEAKAALSDYKEARLNAALSLAALATSGIPLSKFLNLSRFQGKNIAELKALTNILEKLSQNELINKIRTTGKLMGISAQEKIDDFLLLLAKGSESLRIKTLEALKNSEVTPEKLKEIIEQSLHAAKNCAK